MKQLLLIFASVLVALYSVPISAEEKAGSEENGKKGFPLSLLVEAAKTDDEKHEIEQAVDAWKKASSPDQKASIKAVLDKYRAKALSDPALRRKILKARPRSSEDIKKRLKDPTTKFTAGWMMWNAYKKLSEEDRKEFVDMAEKRALKAMESTIVFEGFYVNMPLIDFIALSEEKKIFQKWEKMFSGSSRWHYAEVPDASDLASRYVVTQMIFEGKDWYKLLKCEDDEAFDQFIHQYVLKKTGKASPLTALSKSKLKGPDSYDRWWLTYTSSRYGIAAGWCKDKSFLKLEKVDAE